MFWHLRHFCAKYKILHAQPKVGIGLRGRNTRECKRWACKSSIHREMNWPLLCGVYWFWHTTNYIIPQSTVCCIQRHSMRFLKGNVICIGCIRQLRLWLFV